MGRRSRGPHRRRLETYVRKADKKPARLERVRLPLQQVVADAGGPATVDPTPVSKGLKKNGDPFDA
jgi:hypothetical protein